MDLIFCSGISEPCPEGKHIHGPDDYRNRKGIPALPFSTLTVSVHNPLRGKYVCDPKSIGEHLTKRRLDLDLLQKDVAKRIGVTELTIGNWELQLCEPHVAYYPKIIEFLGYVPFPAQADTLPGKVKFYRYLNGMSQGELAKKLGINESTVFHLEKGTHTPFPKTLAKLKRLLM